MIHELEQNWWILASIDLTRLPAARRANSTSPDIATNSDVEYSAREVAPAQLLVTELIRANSLFLLHHATSLKELLERVGREALCGLLDRYWIKFSRSWDVLLHGNPAATIYNATKLSGGGELGIGVGEEEWGSGEREVLEDFLERTEGLQDLLIGRYGLPPAHDRPSSAGRDSDEWLGTGNDPVAADGLIFSGNGFLSKRSVCTVSQWMEAIFKQGEDAYGIAENPSARPRQHRRRPKLDRQPSSDDASNSQSVQPKKGSFKRKGPSLRKQAIENSATPPGIPAPLVGQVERSLEAAISKADDRSRKDSETQEPDALRKNSQSSAKEPSGFGTENMMKYLTLGYGSSWTLNPKGLKNDSIPSANNTQESNKASTVSTTKPEDERLQQVDPTPDINEDERPFKQKLETSIGRFLIGLSGDLEQAEMDIDEHGSGQDDDKINRPEQRLFLRTLNIDLSRPRHCRPKGAQRANSGQSLGSRNSTSSKNSGPEPKTSAAASVDGPQPHIAFEKVQVAVYVHQPFIFVFMFALHTPNLTIPSFYRDIHSRLGPLQQPLMKSTDPSKTAARIADAIGEKSTTSSSPLPAQQNNPIYDLVYDAAKNSIRTSIPNIPVPGSLAAEGLTQNSNTLLSISGSWYTLGIPVGTAESMTSSAKSLCKSAWSRTEALNAHSQVLNTFSATRSQSEFEHTVKTSRGWWIIWMQIMPSQPRLGKNQSETEVGSIGDRNTISGASGSTLMSNQKQHKEAFLVRKAADFRPNVSTQSRTISTGAGKWLLREQKRDTSDSSIGAASARGVSDGVGVDAKRWVGGLLTLTR